MGKRPLSDDPADRMGVYKQLADVPDRYRLAVHADAYADRDVWAEYVDENPDRLTSVGGRRGHERAGRRWKAHMADRDRHHALARPADVETFIADLLDRFAPGTVYNPHWVRLEAFYDWLTWHADHPHRYNPVLMAAADPDAPATTRLWRRKMGPGSSRETTTEPEASEP